jgi:hypothetical protein
MYLAWPDRDLTCNGAQKALASTTERTVTKPGAMAARKMPTRRNKMSPSPTSSRMSPDERGRTSRLPPWRRARLPGGSGAAGHLGGQERHRTGQVSLGFVLRRDSESETRISAGHGRSTSSGEISKLPCQSQWSPPFRRKGQTHETHECETQPPEPNKPCAVRQSLFPFVPSTLLSALASLP